MLPMAENELLCRIGPGTPMGELMRQYWLPALYTWELENDGRPSRARILGEDLVAWRDSAGRPSFVAAACPHRGASLFFGRNEADGLRCVYHGWKFDVAGHCVDMPNEPPESNFKDKVHARAYAAADHGGIIWIYMGSHETPPGLPDFEWCSLPEEQVHHAYKGIYQANWMQSLEGDIDTSHLYFLHGRLNPDDPPAYGVHHPDKSPRLEILETASGLLYGARREEGDGSVYWRTTQYLMPIFSMFPATEDGFVPSHMYTPIDDNLTMHWGLRWHPTRQMPGDRKLVQEAHKVPDVNGMGPMKPEQKGMFFANWWPEASSENDFFLDRDVQKTMNFTGIPTVRLQDAAMINSMGPIIDRTREHLGTTDAMIIQVRRRLIRAATLLGDKGETPPCADDPHSYRARSCSAILPGGVEWSEALADWHSARTTELPSMRLTPQRSYPERRFASDEA